MSYKYNIVYKGAVIKSNTMMGIAMLIPKYIKGEKEWE